MLWLGIDVGGTFTDLVLYDEATGAIRLEKTPSTPRDHAEGMMTGIGRLAIALDRVERIAYGTTVATNTELEGREDISVEGMLIGEPARPVRPRT